MWKFARQENFGDVGILEMVSNDDFDTVSMYAVPITSFLTAISISPYIIRTSSKRGRVSGV